MAGVPQTVDTLALVCPDPVKDEGICILVGTNTSLVLLLFNSCREQAGEGFLSTLTIHPMIREAYQSISQTDISPEETTKHGTVWFTQRKSLTLHSGQLHVTGVSKFPGDFTGNLAHRSA